MLGTAERTDTELKMNVLAELQFEPTVKVTDIGVLVKDGVVTLNGHAANYGEKMNAVIAAKRVTGVLAVADDIDINLADFGARTDAEIAGSAANLINWSTQIPEGLVNVTVSDGHITLAGAVPWGYQRHAAEAAVQHLAGLKGLVNLIVIQATSDPVEIGVAVRAAFKRNAMLDDADLQVECSGSHVVLSGKVRSHSESEEAARVAWAAPGVLSVDNQLRVEWYWDRAD